MRLKGRIFFEMSKFFHKKPHIFASSIIISWRSMPLNKGIVIINK